MSDGAGIAICGVRKAYVGRGREVLALDRIDLTIEAGVKMFPRTRHLT